MNKFYLILLSIFLFLNLICYGQTREIDYSYMLNHYLSQAINPNYKQKELLRSEIKKNDNVKASIQFTRFKTIDDNKERGISIVYREKKNNNELVRTLVLCFPEENSEPTVNTKALNAIKDLDDIFVTKYVLMGLMKLGIKKY